jgi:hypothetical protein
MTSSEYEVPVVSDYGDLVALTEATSVNGAEDGASKAIPIHSTAPAAP